MYKTLSVEEFPPSTEKPTIRSKASRAKQAAAATPTTTHRSVPMSSIVDDNWKVIENEARGETPGNRLWI